MDARKTIVVRLEPTGKAADWHSLKRLLKHLLRGYGLKCVGLDSEPGKASTENGNQADDSTTTTAKT